MQPNKIRYNLLHDALKLRPRDGEEAKTALRVAIPHPAASKVGFTQGLQCSSFLGLLWFSVRHCNILPKKELRRRVWVGFRVCYGLGFRAASKVGTMGPYTDKVQGVYLDVLLGQYFGKSFRFGVPG